MPSKQDFSFNMACFLAISGIVLMIIACGVTGWLSSPRPWQRLLAVVGLLGFAIGVTWGIAGSAPWVPRLILALSLGLLLAFGLEWVTLPRRRQRLGRVLVTLRRDADYKRRLWAGGILLFTGALQGVSSLAQVTGMAVAPAMVTELTLAQTLLFIALGLINLATSRQRPEIREGGICHRLATLPWAVMGGYRWHPQRPQITLWLKHYFPLQRQCYELQMPSHDADIAEDILAQHVSKG